MHVVAKYKNTILSDDCYLYRIQLSIIKYFIRVVRNRRRNIKCLKYLASVPSGGHYGYRCFKAKPFIRILVGFMISTKSISGSVERNIYI